MTENKFHEFLETYGMCVTIVEQHRRIMVSTENNTHIVIADTGDVTVQQDKEHGKLLCDLCGTIFPTQEGFIMHMKEEYDTLIEHGDE